MLVKREITIKVKIKLWNNPVRDMRPSNHVMRAEVKNKLKISVKVLVKINPKPNVVPPIKKIKKHMQGVDAAVLEDAVDGFRHGFLEFECPLGIQISLCCEIKIYILDVEMGDEGLAVGERAADVEPLLQAVKKLIRRAWLAHRPLDAIGSDVVAGGRGGGLATKELQHPRANGGAFIKGAEGLAYVLHGGEV
jgi:hypothetical protein